MPVILDKHRLESLTDGVFAIVMTLLVLQFQVPQFSSDIQITNEVLQQEFISYTPTILSYFLSFAILAMFWLTHHYIYYKHTQTIDRMISNVNNVYLAFVSLIPFTTGYIAQYYTYSFAVSLYGLNIFIVSIINSIMLGYIWKAEHIDNGQINSRVKKQAFIRINIVAITSLLGIFFAFVYTPISLALYTFAVVFNLIPGTLTFFENLLGFEI